MTEFEEQRDSLEPREVCAFHGEWCAGEESWCTRQCSKCDEAVYWHRDVEAWFHCVSVLDRRPCPYGDGPVVEHSSAAVIAAADPSPNNPRMGDEGSGGDSDILPSPPPEQPISGRNDLVKCSYCPINDGVTCYLDCGEARRIYDQRRTPEPTAGAGESPGGVSADQPSLGEPRPDSKLLSIAATAVEAMTVTNFNGDKTPKWAVRLVAELRDRASQFKVFEREAAGE
ncbi:hypothetical protein [Mycolicibacterium frederiksbergense]|uniref:hypothetical protein n=1 Tax=Mycolicibacterium frederiksbergense TaxID=117567 RepID=UPI002474B20E|nr:hypothetical protein [Mycolicibacterium frederiksbergense]